MTNPKSGRGVLAATLPLVTLNMGSFVEIVFKIHFSPALGCVLCFFNTLTRLHREVSNPWRGDTIDCEA